jgi:hypothetical protein
LFLLNRFDNEGEGQGDAGQDGDPGKGDDPKGDDGPGSGDDPQKGDAPSATDKDLDYWKRRARDNEARAKANAEKAKKFDEAERARLSTEERLAAEAKESADKAAKAQARAVRAEVRALADDFADREDAILNLGDLSRFVDESNEINLESIKTELTDVLNRKPHLKKTPKGRQDPGQGAGRGVDPSISDFRTAKAEDFAAEAAKYGIRPRS